MFLPSLHSGTDSRKTHLWGDYRKDLYVAAGANLISGIALLAIGILAIQWGFLPTFLAYAFIGAGTACSISLFYAIGLIVKEAIAPNSYFV